MTTDPTPDRPSQLRVGSLDYTPGELDTSRLRQEVAEHHQAVAAELIDHAARCVLDILAATMHHADFTYNVTAELVNNLVTFASNRTPGWEQVLNRLDRAIEVLEEIRDARQAKDRPRGYTLGDQFMDLLKRHDQGLVDEAGFYDRVAEMTGISFPSGQAYPHRPTPDEVVRFARGGIVKGPESGEERIIHGDQPPQGGIVVTFDPPHGPSQQEIADATIRALRHQGRIRP